MTRPVLDDPPNHEDVYGKPHGDDEKISWCYFEGMLWSYGNKKQECSTWHV